MKRALALYILLIAVVLASCAAKVAGIPEAAVPYALERVVDGDTIRVYDENNARVRVRLCGVNAPETVKEDTPVEYYGREASAFVQEALADVETVYLEFDRERVDPYDRLMAWVWLPDGTLLNEAIVRNGCSKVSIFGENDKYEKRLRDAARQAQKEHIGVWNEDARAAYRQA